MRKLIYIFIISFSLFYTYYNIPDIVIAKDDIPRDNTIKQYSRIDMEKERELRQNLKLENEELKKKLEEAKLLLERLKKKENYCDDLQYKYNQIYLIVNQ